MGRVLVVFYHQGEVSCEEGKELFIKLEGGGGCDEGQVQLQVKAPGFVQFQDVLVWDGV